MITMSEDYVTYNPNPIFSSSIMKLAGMIHSCTYTDAVSTTATNYKLESNQFISQLGNI